MCGKEIRLLSGGLTAWVDPFPPSLPPCLLLRNGGLASTGIPQIKPISLSLVLSGTAPTIFPLAQDVKFAATHSFSYLEGLITLSPGVKSRQSQLPGEVSPRGHRFDLDDPVAIIDDRSLAAS
jgi:hypothetical protein